MTYSILLYVTRKPDTTPEAFKDHYENIHLPLARELCGEDYWPFKFTRRYLARITRKGFGGPLNPDRPTFLLRGDAQDTDCDCVADMTFESEQAFQAFYKKIYERDVAKVLAADEQLFLDVGKTRVVVIGETISTEYGTTTSVTNSIRTSEASDSDVSASDHSEPSQTTKDA
jgi:hypothetical protein